MLHLSEPLETIEDFNGLIIRTSPLFAHMVEALGASPVILPMSEMYTSLERGVIDGLIMGEYGLFDFGLEDVVKYFFEPRFFQLAANRSMNLDVWNSLSDNVKKVFIETSIETEPTQVEANRQLAADIRQKSLDYGVQVCSLSEAESQEMLDIAYNSIWDYVVEQAPEYGPKFRAAAKY